MLLSLWYSFLHHKVFSNCQEHFNTEVFNYFLSASKKSIHWRGHYRHRRLISRLTDKLNLNNCWPTAGSSQAVSHSIALISSNLLEEMNSWYLRGTINSFLDAETNVKKKIAAHVRLVKQEQVRCVCVHMWACPGPLTRRERQMAVAGGPCLTFRFRAVMDVDLLGSSLPARQQRGPFLHIPCN